MTITHQRILTQIPLEDKIINTVKYKYKLIYYSDFSAIKSSNVPSAILVKLFWLILLENQNTNKYYIKLLQLNS